MTTTVRTILEAKRAELQRSLRDRAAIEAGREPDRIDDMVATAERDTAITLKDRDTRLLREVEDAIARCDSGTWGVCECGEDIATNRLEAVPWTRLCFGCRAAAEAAERSVA